MAWLRDTVAARQATSSQPNGPLTFRRRKIRASEVRKVQKRATPQATTICDAPLGILKAGIDRRPSHCPIMRTRSARGGGKGGSCSRGKLGVKVKKETVYSSWGRKKAFLAGRRWSCSSRVGRKASATDTWALAKASATSITITRQARSESPGKYIRSEPPGKYEKDPGQARTSVVQLQLQL